MSNDTKERILAAALEMFSQFGSAETNFRELSVSLGLVKSGLYKHFESKEAMKRIEAFSRHFISVYGNTEGENKNCRRKVLDSHTVAGIRLDASSKKQQEVPPC